MRIGSLFSGAGGLDMAVEAVFGGEVVWFSEIDKAASKVLAHRFPGVPNLGSITEIDWAAVESVDVLCGGFPCQDVSAAGKRAGIKDGTRSGLWAIFAEAIDALRPRYVVIENVRGLLSATAHRAVESGDTTLGVGGRRPVLRAAGAVLGDLSDLGYDAAWTTLAASAVGAPHRRERVFILATAADAERGGGAWFADTGGNSAADSEGRQAVLPRGLGDPVAFSGGAAVGQHTGGTPGAETGPHSGDGSGDHRGKRADGVALLPTPTAQAAKHGADSRFGGGNGDVSNLWQIAHLLPTPTAALPHDGWTVEQYDTWKAKVHAEGRGANGMRGDSLEIAAMRLLPTPNAQDGNGGKAPRGGRDTHNTGTKRQVPLTDLPDLLPTPTTQDASNCAGPSQFERNTLPLNAEVTLLSTPQSRDFKGQQADNFNNANLCRDVANAAQWGKYAAAIQRWEQVAGPAPAPTEPNRNGKPRLNPEFSSWMMGWPAGWVTDPAIGISRNDQLRIVGNGVCPQQCAAAVRYLLSVVPA